MMSDHNTPPAPIVPLAPRPKVSGTLVALVMAVGFAAGFVVVVYAVGNRTAIVDDDEKIAAKLHSYATTHQHTIRPMQLVTEMGSAVFLAGVVCIVAGVLVARKRYLQALVFIVGVASGSAIVHGMKLQFERARPYADRHDEKGRPLPRIVPFPLVTPETSFSFPSGHSSGATMTYGLAAYFLMRVFRSRLARVLILVVALAIILSIMFSRLFLGVHFLTDTLGGMTFGLAWMFVTIAVMLGCVDPIRREAEREGVLPHPT